MKKFLHICFLAASLKAANNLTAQTVYDIKEDITVTGAKMPSTCEKCIINIADGKTLTINQDIYLKDVTFNGGNLVVKDVKMTYWAPGTFNKVNVTFSGSAALISSGALTINSSDLTFANSSTATLWSTVDMTSSRMKFLDNASMEATGTFNLKKTSALIAGDGTSKSAAFIKFNGGTLNEFDNSYVSLANNSNYYFNWNNYTAEGKSFQTKDNKFNCGTKGNNECSAPVLYGPATMNFAGVAASATLPVKLTAFAAKLSGNKVELTWTTDMEMNAARYEIERSADGMNWKLAGTVHAKGNSSVVVKYSFTDASLVNGTISYRLKMIDQDETAAYSPVRSVKSETAAHEMSVYPNPATEYVVISTKNNTTDKMNIQLINFNGKVLKQTSGSGKVQLSVSEFTSGNYMVRVSDSTGTAQSFKLMITK